ncbi:unnamed protein product, partial [Adineta ricciae]
MASKYVFQECTYTDVPPIYPTNQPATATQISNAETKEMPKAEPIEELTMIIRIKFEYSELKQFVDNLNTPDPDNPLVINNKPISVFHLYALRSTSKPIDMSNQTERLVYRPNLLIRRNDKFGPWNFNRLLNLIELDYRPGTKGNQFPKLWYTTTSTSVSVTIIPYAEPTNDGTEVDTSTDSSEAMNTLEDLLKSISHQNNYGYEDVENWLKDLKGENITKIEHLQNAVMNESLWEKLNGVRPAVKQLIYDYVQLNTVGISGSNEVANYKKSKATLLADIHRVKRYFYDAIGKRDRLTYLDLKAVDSAIQELREFYADDGNIINTIKEYLYTFCNPTECFTEEDIERERKKVSSEIEKLGCKANELEKEEKVARNRSDCLTNEYKILEARWKNKCDEEEDAKAEFLGLTRNAPLSRMKIDEALEKQEGLKNQKEEIESAKKKKFAELNDATKQSNQLAEDLEKTRKDISDRESRLALINADEHRKLKIKIGRGLLLYGPPGTGKSEILKRAAVYAGITPTTVPLAAGELNRPYVGETEKLLIDIMYRANTIPYLMCAMTIDEIDGLVPKRDNNAQQSKVDGISVLLSHIEGVKNIPNLVVFGATNRRNMMDDAFLRRMQAKCFVGRPSPAIRKKMLRPLLTKDLKDFTNERLDFLVKVTTNFSGAAVGALKSSIVSFLADNATTLSDHTLLSLANNTAREFSCWFGSSTLPEICRIYPNIFQTNATNNQPPQFSLVLQRKKPSGRILIDLQERKCFIELSNGPTMEEKLLDAETSLVTLFARIINGCSSRNIDSIQIIDTDFLSKNTAFDENKIIELLATTFAECDEYNRSMFVFDIDSLITLSINDSNMSQSTSISNIQLYRNIREKCKQAFVENKPDNCA